jgi:hypothetical protein
MPLLLQLVLQMALHPLLLPPLLLMMIQLLLLLPPLSCCCCHRYFKMLISLLVSLLLLALLLVVPLLLPFLPAQSRKGAIGGGFVVFVLAGFVVVVIIVIVVAVVVVVVVSFADGAGFACSDGVVGHDVVVLAAVAFALDDCVGVAFLLRCIGVGIAIQVQDRQGRSGMGCCIDTGGGVGRRVGRGPASRGISGRVFLRGAPSGGSGLVGGLLRAAREGHGQEGRGAHRHPAEVLPLVLLLLMLLMLQLLIGLAAAIAFVAAAAVLVAIGFACAATAAATAVACCSRGGCYLQPVVLQLRMRCSCR